MIIQTLHCGNKNYLNKPIVSQDILRREMRARALHILKQILFKHHTQFHLKSYLHVGDAERSLSFIRPFYSVLQR